MNYSYSHCTSKYTKLSYPVFLLIISLTAIAVYPMLANASIMNAESISGVIYKIRTKKGLGHFWQKKIIYDEFCQE